MSYGVPNALDVWVWRKLSKRCELRVKMQSDRLRVEKIGTPGR